MDNVKFIQSLYAAFSEGDLQTIYEACDSRIDWASNADPALIPWGGAHRGPDGVKKFFAELLAHMEFEKFEPRQFLAGDGFVVVLGHAAARMKPSGGHVDDEWAHLLWLRNGKVIRFQEYSDTHALVQAYNGGDVHAVGIAKDSARPPLHH